MKKSKTKIWTIILIIIIIIETITIAVLMNKVSNEESQTTTKISNEKVTTSTIENTLTSSGEISTSSTERLTLDTSKYFKTMCVEENDEVKKGENILQYTDGTYLTATYDCLVSSYQVPTTESICTDDNYIEVKNLDTLSMTLSIDETEISKVTKEQEVTITVNAFDNTTYTGKITKISELGDYSSSGSTYSAVVTFENTDNNIKLGMSATCEIVLEKAENVIVVPIEAVLTKDDEKYVVVVNDDGSTNDVTVQTGISNDKYVEIKSGLSGSETVQISTTTTKSTNASSNSSNNNFGNMKMQGGENMPQGGPGNDR